MRILLILFFSMVSLMANIGQITASYGEVYSLTNGKTKSISTGYKFDKKDIIFTKKGMAHLTFKDSTVITLGENSKLIVEQYFLNNKNIKKSKARFRFVKGLFRTITGAIGHAKHSNFKVFTKTATIGIRGTIFRVQAKPVSNPSEPQTLAAVDEGSIYVTSNSGRTETIGKGEAVGVDLSGNIRQISYDRVGKISANNSKKREKAKKRSSYKSKNSSKNKKKSSRQNKKNKNNQTMTSSKQKGNQSTKGNSENRQNSATKTNVEVLTPVTKKSAVTINESENGVKSVENSVNDTIKNADDEKKSPSETFITPKQPPLTNPNENLLTEYHPNQAQITLADDNYMSFGYWQNSDMSPDSMWIVGKNLTDPDTIIDNYIKRDITATYNGVVKGIEDGKIGEGSINLNINFGSQSINGDMDFKTSGGSKWSMDIAGDQSVYANGFEANLKDSGDSEVKNITGTLDGNFFGKGAEAVGGYFDAVGNGKKVDGVFEGVKR